MSYTGGKRIRLIEENFRHLVKKGVKDLGLMESAAVKPAITFQTEMPDTSKAVQPNTIAVTAEDIDTYDHEIGDGIIRHEFNMYVDIFAANRSIGLELVGDIVSILRGRNEAINRIAPILPVYDLSQQGSPEIFSCDIEEIRSAKVETDAKSFNRFWWSIGCLVIDFDDSV